MNYYTGIGSERVPYDKLIAMTSISTRLANQGFQLRTGSARSGAEKAFRMGMVNFYKDHPQIRSQKMVLYDYEHITPFNINIAKRFFYNWDNLDLDLQMYYAWSVLVVLGPNGMYPSDLVICWTPNGAESEAHCNRRSGKAGFCIKVAREIHIPVINLKRENAMEKLEKTLHTIEKENQYISQRQIPQP